MPTPSLQNNSYRYNYQYKKAVSIQYGLLFFAQRNKNTL